MNKNDQENEILLQICCVKAGAGRGWFSKPQYQAGYATIKRRQQAALSWWPAMSRIREET